MPGRPSRFRAPLAALLSLSALAPASLAAQSVNFAGYTTGCFGLGCVPSSTNAYSRQHLGGLYYINSTFSGTTTNGQARLDAPPGPFNVLNIDNLGSFLLDQRTFVYTSSTFTLAVYFSQPGLGNSQFLASLTGSVAPRTGGVFIDFDNTPQTFAYQNGIVSLDVEDVTLTVPNGPGDATAQVIGNLSVTTPEPGSIALVATGLLGMVGVLRRRRAAEA